MNTKGNRVLITGGTSGIGLALARKFYSEGNRVVVCGRNEESLERVRKELPGSVAERVDLSDSCQVRELAERHSDVNILINNAGVQFNYRFGDPSLPLERVEEELRINLLSVLELTWLYLPRLEAAKDPAIVNVTSGLGLVPKESAPVYCASKAALHLFSRSLRWQLEERSIPVFEIIPPLVRTEMTRERNNKGMISPDDVVREFWKAFQKERQEIPVGKVKLLKIMGRLSPSLTERIMRRG